jgi:CDP-paratose 2-epimerase
MKRIQTQKQRPVLITGGAGFIGTNVANRLLDQGRDVLVFDNLSRPGVERNLSWLLDRHGHSVRFIEGDVRNQAAVNAAVAECGQIFHFAAQVAVTTSLEEPITDFETNARGTLHVLEAIRKAGRRIPLLLTSTNKVYGDLHDVELHRGRLRYEPAPGSPAANGISELRPVDFHSPYGCSKGAADQYVLDYARTFGIPATVFRMSCIYGPHQFGTEDQGWVAHFLLQAMRGESVTFYGDGRQVRDILFVEDLVNAMLLAHETISATSGHAFNIGGGTANTVSLLELASVIGDLQGAPMDIRFADWRTADQRYYVSDIRGFGAITGWKPAVGVREGVARLHKWLLEHRDVRGKGILESTSRVAC